MTCCSKHVLPFQWVGNPCLREGIQVTSKTFRAKILNVYDDVRNDVVTAFSGTTVSFALDGFYIIPVKNIRP